MIRRTFRSIGDIHILSWILMIVLDLSWNVIDFAEVISIAGIITIPLSSMILFVICFIPILLIQRILCDDSWAEAAIKAAVMGLVAAVPFSVISFISKAAYDSIRGAVGGFRKYIARAMGVKNWKVFEARAMPLVPENVKILLSRIERSYPSGDFPDILHQAASIFETMAKDIFQSENNYHNSQILIEKFGWELEMKPEMIKQMVNAYDWRNREPLAGHGSMMPPRITQSDADKIIELVKNVVLYTYSTEDERADQVVAQLLGKVEVR